MPIDRSDAEAFFRDYSKALVTRDPKAIARYWGAPGLVLSDDGEIR